MAQQPSSHCTDQFTWSRHRTSWESWAASNPHHHISCSSLPDGAKAEKYVQRGSSVGVAVQRDVAYSPEGSRSVLDIYTPTTTSQGSLPVILFLHGGVWASGEKWSVLTSSPLKLPNFLPFCSHLHCDSSLLSTVPCFRHYAPMACRLVQEGFVVVVPSYELYPKALVPQMVGKKPSVLG